MNWLMTQINRLKTWWNANHAEIQEKVVTGTIIFKTQLRTWWKLFNVASKFGKGIGRGIFRISRNICRLILMGIIVIIASNFYPEFPKRFPTIYAWFDGWLQFGEFALKSGLGFIFKGNSINFWSEYDNAFKEMLSQFVRWLSTIHF